jgi:hypothetical protein
MRTRKTRKRTLARPRSRQKPIANRLRRKKLTLIRPKPTESIKKKKLNLLPLQLRPSVYVRKRKIKKRNSLLPS